MTPNLTVPLVLGVAFLAAFTRSALGFGDALIAMPLLTMLIGIRMATPLVALAASTIAISIFSQAWRDADLRAAWRLILSSLVGIPIGLFFLKRAPQTLVEALLSVVLVGFGLYNLFVPRLPVLANEKLSYLFGFVAGILGGAYNTNGPPVVVYATLRRWEPARFRATLQGYFLPTGLTVAISHGLAGFWTRPVLQLYLYALPVILLAVFIGGHVNRRVSGGQFHRLVYAALVAIGLLLLV
jgi:uncharacterized membrane protein YfcA